MDLFLARASLVFEIHQRGGWTSYQIGSKTYPYTLSATPYRICIPPLPEYTLLPASILSAAHGYPLGPRSFPLFGPYYTL